MVGYLDHYWYYLFFCRRMDYCQLDLQQPPVLGSLELPSFIDSILPDLLDPYRLGLLGGHFYLSYLPFAYCITFMCNSHQQSWIVFTALLLLFNTEPDPGDDSKGLGTYTIAINFRFLLSLFLWIYRQRCNVGSSELRHYCPNL